MAGGDALNQQPHAEPPASDAPMPPEPPDAAQAFATHEPPGPPPPPDPSVAPRGPALPPAQPPIYWSKPELPLPEEPRALEAEPQRSYGEATEWEGETEWAGQTDAFVEPALGEPEGGEAEPFEAEPPEGQPLEPELMLPVEVPPPALPQPSPPTSDVATLLAVACPYLRSTDGTWRSAVAANDQRCWGSSPPLPLAPATQDRLCRTPGHVRCEIFQTAQASRADALARDHLSPAQLDGRFGVLVRPTPLVLDRSPSLAGTLPARRPRGVLGFAIVGALALVVLIVLAAVLGGSGGNPASTQLVGGVTSPTPVLASPSPASQPSSPPPSASPTPIGPSPSPSRPSASGSAPPSPSIEPSATPRRTQGPNGSPRIARTYRVHKGDSLASIAQKFGVTPREIVAVNDLGDPPRLLFGQLINIPVHTP